MRLTLQQRQLVRAVQDCNSNSFVEMAEIAKLNPASDFIQADLRGIDFKNDNLAGFNFTGADLRGADLTTACGLERAILDYVICDTKTQGLPIWRLYHGTTGYSADLIAKDGINLTVCRPLSDFGRGFYTNLKLEPAVTHANNIYRRQEGVIRAGRSKVDPLYAACLVFEVDRRAFSQLKSLVFTNYSSEWLRFVRHNRSGQSYHMPEIEKNYDAVCGPMPIWRISIKRTRRKAWNTTFVQNQVSFHSQFAIHILRLSSIVKGSPLLDVNGFKLI